MKTYEQYEKAILRAIEKSRETQHPIKFFSQIFDHYRGISYTTFFALKLNESDSIKTAIEENRKKKCAHKVEQWLDNENPTLQLAGFKLICTDEERNKLATTVKADAKVDGVHKVQVTFDEADEG